VIIRDGIVENCLIVSNSARGGGGIGFFLGGYAKNCTLVGNSASIAGGGIYIWNAGEVFYNSIIYDNTAPTGDNYYVEGTGSFSYCCTTPDPSYLGGTNNITDPPLFINASQGNFRLRFESPCRDAGTNTYDMFGTVDLDGNPRIVNLTVDMGAYEYFDPNDLDLDSMNDLWEIANFGNTNVANYSTDYDQDGELDWQEYLAGTQPTNKASRFFALISLSNDAPCVFWNPDLGTTRVYTVEGKESISNQSWSITNEDSRYYRVKVEKAN